MKNSSNKQTHVTEKKPSSSDVQSPSQPFIKNDSAQVFSNPSFSSWGNSRPTWGHDEQAPWRSPVNYDKYAPFANESYGLRVGKFDEAMKAITNSCHPLYRPCVGSAGQKSWKRSPLSKYFADLNGFMGLTSPGCPQTEHIKLFFKHLNSMELQDIYFTRPSELTAFPANQNVSPGTTDEPRGPFKMQAEICNELAYAMQLEGKTQAFKDRVVATGRNAFEVVLIRESQVIKELQEERKEISEYRHDFLRTECGINLREPTCSEAEVAASRHPIAQLQLNRFAIARLQNAKKIIDRQLVIANAWHGDLLVQLCDPE